jgi:gamma-glutamyl-gamma-aminobutyrate hydrolase PuuD
MPGRRFVVGVQWHPEEMVEASDSARRLFAGVVNAARHDS